MRRFARNTTGGFTLIEVLVAVVIFALFSAIAYGGLLRMLDTRDRIEQEREFWHNLALTYTRLGDDLAQVMARPVRDAYGQPLPAFLGKPTDTRALADPSLEFTRGGVVLFGDEARADLQRVAFRLKDDTLQRLVWTVLDRPPVSEPAVYPLLENVEEFTVRFHAPGGGWAERWPPNNELRGLPDAVEVTLGLRRNRRFTRVFYVHR